MKTRKCRSCGDAFSPTNRRTRLRDDGQAFFDGELDFCRECADELFRGQISTTPAKLYSSGRGCPLEPSNFDPSPMDENSIRMKEDQP